MSAPSLPPTSFLVPCPAPGLLLFLALLLAAPAASPVAVGALHAQTRIEVELPPQEVRLEIVEFLNDPTVIRMDGGGRIPAGRVLEGDLAVLEGSLVLAGTVTGDLVVVNGDLRLGEGAAVAGAVTVVGGGVEGSTAAEVDGSLTVYAQRLRYVREAGIISLLGPAQRDEEGFSPSLGFGRSRFTVRAGTNYNRVEGLPVMFGPIVETASSNPLRLEALAVWRTDDGFHLDPEDLGYRVRLEQYLGGRELFSVGAGAHSLVEPVERWALSDLESSLATFLFHKDYRDYLERKGWSAFARLRAPGVPLELELEYLDEDQVFSPIGSPWALKDNEKAWRPQPLVATGRLRSVQATMTFDTRNDVEEPTHGWWIQARADVGVDGDLGVHEHVVPYAPGPPATDAPDVTVVPRATVDPTFGNGFLDARRYNRVGPSTELVLRTVLGGSLTGDPLLPQYQNALGGEGSLPGFPLFSVDCGARRSTAGLPVPGSPVREEVFPAYGCDRVALFQTEIRGDLGWSLDVDDLFGPTRGEPFRSGQELRPRWAAFFDAGRGWSLGDAGGAGGAAARFDEETRLDVGLGLLVRGLGVYWAFPLSGDDRTANFFVRLDHRF